MILKNENKHCTLYCTMHEVWSMHIHMTSRLDGKGDVRVGDFGLAEDMYGTGYVRDHNKTVKVPFKWMSPESLEEGLFSEQSDVVG